MAKAIFLYNYNKYYNRIIKRLDTFAEYQALIVSPDEGITPPQYRGLLREGFNFDYADGVHASKVLNIAKNEDMFFKTEHPDYVVIEEEYNAGTLEEPSITNKVSRWFVLDLLKLRGNQFRLSLRRDLLADFFSEITSAPAFIERGNPVVSDPAIFNKEGFTYNQIKKKELKLDFTKLSGKGGGWVVGYLARGANVSAISATGHQTLPPSDLIPDYSTLPQALRDLISNGGGYETLYKWETRCATNRLKSGGTESNEFQIIEEGDSLIDSYGSEIRVLRSKTITSGGTTPSNFTTRVYVNADKKVNNTYFTVSELSIVLKNAYDIQNDYTNFIDLINTWYESLNLTYRFTNLRENYNNLIIKKDGAVYKIVFKKRGNESLQSIGYSITQVKSGASALALAFKNMIADHVATFSGLSVTHETVSTPPAVLFGRAEQAYDIYLEKTDFQTITATIPATRNENLEAPYDLFCIPMGEVGIKNNNVLQFTTMINSALAIARGIAVAGTTTNVYDIQILPYCPYPDIINSDGDIDIYGYDENKDYSYIKQTVGGTDYNIGIILYPRSCRGTFDLTIPSDFDGFNEYCAEETIYPIEKKVKSETQIARFVSPNFSAMFDFNVQKNEGLSELNVDYFLKPYSPYIHIAPYFKGLYGSEFNDPKGLICSGDFSISTAQSQWAQYEIQNKNYELIFNREIKNLDVNNSIAYEQAEFSGTIGAITSAVQGATSGAMSGAMTGNPFVAAAGAVVGGAVSGITSAIGLQKDLEFLSRSQQEARSFKSDMFTYQLGNIKALPNSLTKVSSLTENNKIFPFIEFYDCTEEEKEALRNKIRYNGMTIMRIGTIADFIDGDNNYVQAQLIRLLGLTEDNHVVSEIAKEIKMGAYYYGNNSSES